MITLSIISTKFDDVTESFRIDFLIYFICGTTYLVDCKNMIFISESDANFSDILRARYFTFADDTAQIYVRDNEQELVEIINEDLNLYYKWLITNRLKINIEKTQFMLFKQKNKHVANMNIKINNVNLERASCVKYLGLVIDESLSWQMHINKITQKVHSLIPCIYKSRSYLTHRTKMNVYNAFFVSHMRYLLPIWGTCKTKFSEVQVTQNKVLKIMFNYNKATHTETLYRELGVFNLERLLLLEQCKVMYKILNKQLKCNSSIIFSNEIHNYYTRTELNLYIKSDFRK